MGARLQTRIERIEETNAPLLKLVAARRRIYDHFNKSIHSDINYALEFSAYLGSSADRETIKSDLVAFCVLATMELEVRFPRLERTRERTEAAMVYTVMREAREYYGRELTFEEAKNEIELCERAEADYHAGVPFSESEAAQCYQNRTAQYPRLKIESDSMAAYLRGADARTL